MRKRDAVGYSSLPSSPTSMNGRHSQMHQHSQEENHQPQNYQHHQQESDKENREDSQKELDSFCNDYTISQNHNVKPQKKPKNLSMLKTYRHPSPSQSSTGGGVGKGSNGTFMNSSQVSTPINMNRIAGTSVYDSRNHRMELNNAYKLIDILKRENTQIKSKSNQDTFLIDQVGNLKSDIIMKQREIEELKVENKTLKKIKRKQESALGNHSEENKINMKIQNYQNQILELTTALKTEKNKNQQAEKNSKKQHAFMSDIYNEYRFICQQQNLQPKIKFEKYNQLVENNNAAANNNNNNGNSNNNEFNEFEEENEEMNQSNSQKQFPDTYSSLLYQKQISDIISMPFTQQNFMRLKEMALQYIKQLEEINNQQKRENQRQQRMILQQQQEQQRMENLMLQQSLNKQRVNVNENNNSRNEQQTPSDEGSQQSSQRTQQNHHPPRNPHHKEQIQRNEIQIPSSSRQSNRVNRKSFEIINEEDFESSQKARHNKDKNEKRTYTPDDIPKKIESDHGNKITNFQKQEQIQKDRDGVGNDPQQNGHAKKEKSQTRQLTLNPIYFNEPSQEINQNDDITSEVSISSKLQVFMKEAYVGDQYQDIDGRDFNDRTFLKRRYTLKIVSISVFISKEFGFVCGLKCDYADKQDIYTKESKIIKGKDNVFGAEHTSRKKIQFENGDYLQNISIVYDMNDKFIRQIMFVTENKKTYIAGETDFTGKEKNLQNQKLDIRDDEYPVCMFGTLKPYTNGNKQNPKEKGNSITDCVSCISYLGFQIGANNEDEYEELNSDESKITRKVKSENNTK